MPRIIGVDYGMKRTGIAVTDPLQIIATPLETIESSALIDFLAEYFSREEVESIVIGDPKNLNNTPAEISEAVNDLEVKLKKQFPGKKIVRVDERFTSKIAHQTIVALGKSKKARRDKSLLDKVSAALILQNYLDSKKA